MGNHSFPLPPPKKYFITHHYVIYKFYLGEWVKIQQRGQYGNTGDYFTKNLDEYEAGFESNGELWLGLEEIAEMTGSGTWELEVDVMNWSGGRQMASYGNFKVGQSPRFVLFKGRGYNMFKDYNRITSKLQLKKMEFKEKLPHNFEVLLRTDPKVPEFCLLVEGNPDSLKEPVACNITTLTTELTLLGWESR